MSTTMSASERARFLQALREDHEFRNAVRSELLSKELLELPERFAQFADYVNTFIEEQRAFNARTDASIEEQRAFNARTDASIEELRGGVEELRTSNARAEAGIEELRAANARAEAGIEELRAANARTEAGIEELRELYRRADVNIGILKGNAARRLLRVHHDTILEIFELDFVRTLERGDLTSMVRNSGVAAQIEFGQRRSFYAADMVLEGTDAEGNTHYVAAEASFTADRRDTDRALRNAEFLTRFTGHPAHPMVASVANDHAVQELVDQGAIRWLQLDEREIEAD